MFEIVLLNTLLEQLAHVAVEPVNGGQVRRVLRAEHRTHPNNTINMTALVVLFFLDSAAALVQLGGRRSS